MRAPSNASTVCLFVLRWGGWPPWVSLLLRTMEMNPTLHFLLLGDKRPRSRSWPSNVAFFKQSLAGVKSRAHSALGVANTKLTIDGGGSKISDFKPMLAHLFPELLQSGAGGRPCAFWGWQQEDQLLGDIRSFLEPSFLAAYDIISPLPKPFYHAGPFMIYRNTPHVNSLYRKSKEWRKVVKSPYYLAFDEWWGADLEDDMCDVVQRESEAGRLRAYTSKPEVDGKGWLVDDYVYADKRPPRRAPKAPSLPSSSSSSSSSSSRGNGDAWASLRWYDDSLLMTWSVGTDGIGRLWSRGVEPAITSSSSSSGPSLPPPPSHQHALVHLMGSKHRMPLRGLSSTDRFELLASTTTTFHLTSRGIFLLGATAVSGGGRRPPFPVERSPHYSWYSGTFPSAHALISHASVVHSMERLAKLGKPTKEGSHSLLVDQLLPCVSGARHDEQERSDVPVPPARLGLIACGGGKMHASRLKVAKFINQAVVSHQ